MRKIRPQNLFHWSDCLFFKNFCFQQALRCYRIYPISSTVNVRKSFGPFKYVPWGLSHPIVRKNRPQNFFHWSSCLFFKKLCFQQAFRCYRIYSLTSTVKVRKPFGPFKNVPWGLSNPIRREKKATKFLSLERLSFFSKICVFNKLLCVGQMILQIPQKMSKYLLNPDILSLETCRTRQYEKICTKSSLHWEDCLFFKNFLFSTTS